MATAFSSRSPHFSESGSGPPGRCCHLLARSPHDLRHASGTTVREGEPAAQNHVHTPELTAAATHHFRACPNRLTGHHHVFRAASLRPSARGLPAGKEVNAQS
jgi:hypothetical protein